MNILIIACDDSQYFHLQYFINMIVFQQLYGRVKYFSFLLLPETKIILRVTFVNLYTVNFGHAEYETIFNIFIRKSMALLCTFLQVDTIYFLFFDLIEVLLKMASKITGNFFSFN